MQHIDRGCASLNIRVMLEFGANGTVVCFNIKIEYILVFCSCQGCNKSSPGFCQLQHALARVFVRARSAAALGQRSYAALSIRKFVNALRYIPLQGVIHVNWTIYGVVSNPRPYRIYYL